MYDSRSQFCLLNEAKDVHHLNANGFESLDKRDETTQGNGKTTTLFNAR